MHSTKQQSNIPPCYPVKIAIGPLFDNRVRQDQTSPVVSETGQTCLMMAEASCKKTDRSGQSTFQSFVLSTERAREIGHIHFVIHE